MSIISKSLFEQAVGDKTAGGEWALKAIDGIKSVLFGSRGHTIRKGMKMFNATEAGAGLLKAKQEAGNALRTAVKNGIDKGSQEYATLLEKSKAAGAAYGKASKQYVEGNAENIMKNTFKKRAIGATIGVGGTGYAIHKATEEPEHWYDRFTKSGNFNDIPLYLQDKIASGTGFDPLAMVDKTAGSGEDSVFIGGWKSKDGSRKNPSALGIVSSGLLAGAADDLYTQRRAKGRGAVRSALGYLNAPIGALGGGLAGAALAPVTFGLSMPIGAAAGAAGQIAMAGNESPYVHILPTLGGAGIGAVLGAGIGGNVNTSPARGFNDTGAIIGGLAGAGLGGLGGYALSRLIN